jgi:hypothetical protein
MDAPQNFAGNAATGRVETRGVAAAVELPAGAMATLVW